MYIILLNTILFNIKILSDILIRYLFEIKINNESFTHTFWRSFL